MGFSYDKIMWTNEEMDAGESLDRVYEAVKKYRDDGGTSVQGLIVVLTQHAGDIYEVYEFLFKGEHGLQGVLDRFKDLACMLERDNDWIAAK